MEIVKSSKRLKTTHEDFISELPDSVLVHILSFLPTQDAIKTVLLQRFGNLWRSVPVIDISGSLSKFQSLDDDDNEDINVRAYQRHNGKFSSLLHHVTNLHGSGTLDKLRLELCIPDNIWNDFGWKKGVSDHIDKFVGYAINRKVQILYLNFKGGCDFSPSELYALPDDVFRSNCLIDTRLTCCGIESCKEINWKMLRVLLLEEVLLSDETMENILLGSPLLEDLSLVNCYGLGKLYCSRNKNLKKLMLKLSATHPDGKLLHVSCPHVTSLEIAGWIDGAKLLDVSSPIDVSISFTSVFGLKQSEYDGGRKLLQMISLCKTITLCGYTILMLSVWNFANVPCASYQWKNLIIKLDLTKWHHPGLSWLLKSCQSVERLTIHIGPEDYKLLSRGSKLISDYCDPRSCWDHFQEARFPCLECITVHGYINEPFVDQMLKFLLKNAPKLQKMVISIKEIFKAKKCDAGKQYDECSSCQVLKIVQELSASARASSHAMICISC